MSKVAYRFLPCDEDGRTRENSQYTSIRDADEVIGVGSVIHASLFGYDHWEVIEIRDDSGGLTSASSEGTAIPLCGTLVCRAVEGHC